MSNRNSLATLVQTKMQAARQRISSETNNISDSLDQSRAKGQILGDYQLYFQGASEALASLGLPEEETRPIALAQKAIEADIEAERNRTLLEEELRSQE